VVPGPAPACSVTNCWQCPALRCVTCHFCPLCFRSLDMLLRCLVMQNLHLMAASHHFPLLWMLSRPTAAQVSRPYSISFRNSTCCYLLWHAVLQRGSGRRHGLLLHTLACLWNHGLGPAHAHADNAACFELQPHSVWVCVSGRTERGGRRGGGGGRADNHFWEGCAAWCCCVMMHLV
jgi:hypothetical protein